MTKTEFKKINTAVYSFLVFYLYNKTDFNRAFLKLTKELGLLEQLMKDFILSLSKEDKEQLLEILTRDKEKWYKLDDCLYSHCLSLVNN